MMRFEKKNYPILHLPFTRYKVFLFAYFTAKGSRHFCFKARQKFLCNVKAT